MQAVRADWKLLELYAAPDGRGNIMGVRDLPVWGRLAAMLANDGLDAMGAKKCAKKGHKWHDVGAVVLRSDGSVDELPRGAMQRCRRCGVTRDPSDS